VYIYRDNFYSTKYDLKTLLPLYCIGTLYKTAPAGGGHAIHVTNVQPVTPRYKRGAEWQFALRAMHRIPPNPAV
jgi:hypothetical protein